MFNKADLLNMFPVGFDKVTTESKIKKSIEEFQSSYEGNVKNAIKTSKLIIFIATNDSVKSEKCIELLELSRDMNIPIVSLIIEEIKNLDGIKSTVLFEIYKDRIFETGYDQYMMLGEHFQNFIAYVSCILNIEKRISKVS